MFALPPSTAVSRTSRNSSAPSTSSSLHRTKSTDMATVSTQDHRWMRRSRAIAEATIPTSTPTPRVASVLAPHGRWLAEGFTQRAGGRHAEADALHQAAAQGIDVRGATAYVTLEPCSHVGRTPPCADALVDAGITRVVAAMVDPNPKVAGQGVA